MEPKARNEEKKPYQVPELSIHGDVEEITQYLQEGTADGDLGEFSATLDIIVKDS